MNTVEYTALIRTFNSEATLPTTLASLTRQTMPPSRFVFVDSGSTDGTLRYVPPNSVVHRFVGEEFNYAESLNQGLRLVTTDYVLIVSSHTNLLNRGSIEYALDLLRTDATLGAAYFSLDEAPSLAYTVIDKSSFNGFNGLFNTCAIIKVGLLRERGFRKEVFTAEDQEWAKWLLLSRGGATARIAGAGMRYDNPKRNSIRKRLNEYVSVAYFVDQSLLNSLHILRIASNVIRPRFTRRISFRDRLFYLLLSFRLLRCRFSEPRQGSRYF